MGAIKLGKAYDKVAHNLKELENEEFNEKVTEILFELDNLQKNCRD